MKKALYSTLAASLFLQFGFTSGEQQLFKFEKDPLPIIEQVQKDIELKRKRFLRLDHVKRTWMKNQILIQKKPKKPTVSAPPSPASDTGGIAARIRECESNNQNVRNRQGSSASGYYQFLDSTWESVTGLPAPAMAYPFEVQHQAFLELWDNGRGASHWAPSRSCWGG